MTYKPQEVLEFFKAHWTVRKYKPISIPAEHLDVILEAAQRAPTDATAQMYSFIRLTDPPVRTEVAKLSNNPHIATASESFVICADVYRLEEILKSNSFELGTLPHIAIHFAIGDAVLAGQNMLIAAEMLGYRGCWIGGILNALNPISELLDLPHGVFPFAGLTIGVADEAPLHRPRLARKLVVHENKYRRPDASELADAVSQMATITHRGNWAQTLNSYFGKGGGMEEREKVLSAYLHKSIFRDKI